MKKVLFFTVFLILLITVFTGVVGAKEIDKIVVQGLTRSNEELVRRQLPYKKGDQWTEELKKITKKRLFEMMAFNPLTLAVKAEELAADKVKVIINAEDPNPFMIHPIEFGVFKVSDLTSEKLTQYVLNPLGNGINFNLGVDWSSDPWWQVEADYVGSQGRKYTVSYKDFDNNENFNTVEYKEVGSAFMLELQQIPKYDLILKHRLKYKANSYQEEKQVNQKYLLLGTNISYEKYGETYLGFDYGHGLATNNPKFGLLTLRWDKFKQIGDDKLVFSFKTGLASATTPFSYQFKAGGYNDLPFRGTGFDLAGTKYLIGNTEYQKVIIEDQVLVIGFLDTGKVIPADSNFGTEDWKLDAGGGLAVITPLGPARADVGVDLLADGYEFNVGFGHTF